jgi:hypothetical protein
MPFFDAFREAMVKTILPRVVSPPKLNTEVTDLRITADSFKKKYTKNGTVKN